MWKSSGEWMCFLLHQLNIPKYIDNLKSKETGFSIAGSYIEFYIVENRFTVSNKSAKAIIKWRKVQKQILNFEIFLSDV